MRHELWIEPSGALTFCLDGPMGDDARALLEPGSTLEWTCDAASHLEAMAQYYDHMGWGEYNTDFPEIDGQTYASRGWELDMRAEGGKDLHSVARSTRSNRLPPEQVAAIRGLHAHGVPIRAIVRRLGVNRATVQRYVR